MSEAGMDKENARGVGLGVLHSSGQGVKGKKR
jgi:hypothetical protein